MSKKHNWYQDLKYQYSSKNHAVAYNLSATHGMEVYLMKQFRGASLSAGVYNILMPEITVNNTFLKNACNNKSIVAASEKLAE